MPVEHLTSPSACMQVNMELDVHGVALKSYFRRHLVRGRPQRHLSMRQGHDYMRNASCPLPQPALISSDSGHVLEKPQEAVPAGQLPDADDNGSLVNHRGEPFNEASEVWQPGIATVMQMPRSPGTPLVELGPGDVEWEEASCSGIVRVAIEEEELAAAAA